MSIGLGMLIGVTAFAASAIGVAAVRRYALRVRLVDIPNARSSHTVPTPRGGGLAFVVTIVGGLVAASISFPELRTTEALVVLTCFVAISLVSWIDDVHSVPQTPRLMGHLLAAVLVVIVLDSIHAVELPWAGSVSLGWGAPLLTVIWIVGLTNAFNFMDGIDGIAGTQSLVAGVGLALLGLIIGVTTISIVGILLAGAAMGFLVHNWPPARIFMGDVGSAFAGFCIATAVVAGAQIDERFAVAGLLLVAPFVLDTTFTFVRRLTGGDNVFQPHRSHLYQRLVITGVPHRKVSIAFGAASTAGLGIGVLWIQRTANVGGLVAAYPILLAVGLYLWVRSREAHQQRSAIPPAAAAASSVATSAEARGR